MPLDAADHMRALVRYNKYANDIVLKAMSGLTAGQLNEPDIASRGSIRANMEHVLIAQQAWLGRLGHAVDSADRSTDALVAYTNAIDAETLSTVCAYGDSRGFPHARPIWQILTQIVTHGTQHRAEAGILLAKHRQSPGDIDFVYFCQDILDK